MQGRDLTYVLPVQYVRILSMVPPDATDIRDTRDASFNRIESIAFRAGVLEIVAVTLVALGGLMTILALVGIARRTQRAKGPVERLISRPALLRLAARELSAAQRESVEQGWNESLVTRAVSALRISAAGALGRPVSQRLVDPTAEQGQGRFLIKRVGRGKRMAVSSSVTGEDVARELARLPAHAAPSRRQLLEDLQATLDTLSAAQYGRPAADRTVDRRRRHQGHRDRPARAIRVRLAARVAAAGEHAHPPAAARDVIGLNRIRTLIDQAIAEWHSVHLADLQFWHRSEARLALFAILALELCCCS